MSRKEVHICLCTYNRQDLLRGLMMSIKTSTVMPDKVWIIDHGYDVAKIQAAVANTIDIPIDVITLEDPGCAHAGNWFLRNVPEERIGIGDDVLFHPDTIEKMIETPGDFVVTRRGQGGFPCSIVRDSCIEKVGYFDETISPQYLYFEDWDYTNRMAIAGVEPSYADCEYTHVDGGSQSYKVLTPAQQIEHNRRFLIAKGNYIRKWGWTGNEEFFK